MKLEDVGEMGLIRRISRAPRRKEVIVGIGDDAAAIKLGDRIFLYTTDMLIEGDHFNTNWATPQQIGRKAMISNISDIAAMGGTPSFALISMSLTSGVDVAFVEDLFKGMWEIGDRYNVEIIGGDTTHGGLMVISITIVGETDEKNLTLRSGATVGDYILVSGPLGGSRAGLDLLLNGYQEPEGPITKHLDPVCRIDISATIAPYVNAMIDVSDGLASEVIHICEESGVGAIIDAKNIPLDPDTVEAGKILGTDPVSFALNGGEDFELIFTAQEENIDRVRPYGVIVGRILEKNEGIKLKDGEIKDLIGGYDHFLKRRGRS